MDDIELKAEIDELKASNQTTDDNDLVPADIPKKKPPKKEDGIFGVFTFQMILALAIAICYVLCLTAFKTETDAVTQKLKQKLVTDFSFQQTVYTTVGNLFTYLNNLSPADAQNPPPRKGIAASDVTSDDTTSTEEVAPSSNQSSSATPSSSESTSSANTSSALIGAGGAFQEADGAVMPTNATFAPVIFTGSILYPIKKGAITSEFGFRINPVNNKPDFHNALDIAAPQNTSVRAAADGVVIKSEFDDSLGNFIRIQHSGGFVTTYGHCERLIAKVGMQIKEGEIIAKVGSTGDSTGPHLHFGTAVNGVYFDPTYLYDTKLGLS